MRIHRKVVNLSHELGKDLLWKVSSYMSIKNVFDLAFCMALMNQC